MNAADSSAIIDIGSNSIRLVVYNGANRTPNVVFNEKVMAGLGAGLATNGMMSHAAMEMGLAALIRYRNLLSQMHVQKIRVVATAALREASNAQIFIDEVKALGLPLRVLSGDEEACAAGYGVISAFPLADGIVGDLGGGSLELIRVKGGAVQAMVSLPLGVLRLKKLRANKAQDFSAHLRDVLKASGWPIPEKGLTFYLVGGSWRALARVHMHMHDYPLAVLHDYTMPAGDCRAVLSLLSDKADQKVRQMRGVPEARLSTLEDSGFLLSQLAEVFQLRQLTVSAYGLREGLLYQELNATEQQLHPLIAGARAEAQREGRFTEHGDVLDQWISPLFPDALEADHVLRHAACLLSDVSWRAHPDFRAEHGLDAALHGNWVGIDARGRALLGQALYTCFGGAGLAQGVSQLLANEVDLHRARLWGLAIRLGQRFSGGVARPLINSRLILGADSVALDLRQLNVALWGSVVERRHKQLAQAMQRKPIVLSSY